MNQTDLTLIIPAKNESESLPIILDNLKKFNFKIIISLHSEDKLTISSNSNYKVEIVSQSAKAYGNALIEGIKATKTKYCCIINADGSMNPKYLKKMIKLCETKDLIFTSRYQKPGGGSEDDDIVTFIGNL